MQIERQVRAVECDVLLHESRHPAVGGAGERFEPAPKQAVVHEQQIAPLLRRHPHGRFAQVDRCRDACDVPRVRQLESVERRRGVRYVGNSEVCIEVAGQLDEPHQGQ